MRIMSTNRLVGHGKDGYSVLEYRWRVSSRLGYMHPVPRSCDGLVVLATLAILRVEEEEEEEDEQDEQDQESKQSPRDDIKSALGQFSYSQSLEVASGSLTRSCNRWRV